MIYSFFFLSFATNLDAQEILNDELKKKPCAKFPSGMCQFGAMCRFSHYLPAELAKLKQKGKHSKNLLDQSFLMNSKHFLF